MQHSLRKRERGSKIYSRNDQSITINNDRSHQTIDEVGTTVKSVIQEKKQIDKMLHSIIKQRLFGNFLSQDTKLSNQNTYILDKIIKANINTPLNYYQKSLNLDQTRIQKNMMTSRNRNTQTIDSTNLYHPSFYTRNLRTQTKYYSSRDRYIQSNQTQKLPKLALEKLSSKIQDVDRRIKLKEHEIIHFKKLKIDEKAFADTFRKFSGAIPNQLIYDVKISREILYHRLKASVEPKMLERFFYFFNFPMIMGFRQYCNLIENAVNCNLKFIYFFIFSVIDQNCNGLITASDMFKFMQKFLENTYIEEQIYLITEKIGLICSEGVRDIESQPLVQEILVVNHNLKMEQIRELVKQSAKERIDVDCVKSTCYHQSILSLQHDYAERLKKNQIQNTQLASKNNKSAQRSMRYILEGLRLRDFYQLFQGKRPRLFCYLIGLLLEKNSADFE